MEKFKAWYEAAGYTKESLAVKLGVSTQAIYKWLSEERRPNQETMNLIFTLSQGEIEPNDFILTGKRK